jgi:thymidylate synthase ThyX
MTGSLRNWTHFLKLRLHEGAQFEVQTVANQVKDILLDKFGYSGKVLLEKEK